MEEYLTPSIIAALTALVLSLITLFQFFRNQRFQQKQFEELNNRNLTTKLYDLRLDYYPKAFDITDNIIKEKGGNYNPTKLSKTLNELIDWKKGVVNLIISVESRDSYFELRDVLMKNPSENGDFSNAQIKKIECAKRNFRKQLRRDLGFMFREEKNRRKSQQVTRGVANVG
ncbi:MAG: hypothetical protein PHI03_13880 [Bacteroidales bacterium]|nr:hypothetical protein [Bacteroidales bacterium]